MGIGNQPRGRMDPSELNDAIRELWTSERPLIFERIASLSAALSADGDLEPEARTEALRVCHMLAGSLGSYGFPEGTRLARQLEKGFQQTGFQYLDLLALTEALQSVVEGEPDLGREESTSSSNIQIPVLILDDDKAIRDLMSLQARARGFLPTTASTIEEGIEEAHRITPGAVILDFGFPGEESGGIEFLKAIDKFEDKPPVVMLTGQHDFVSRLTASRLGAIGFVQKPASPAVVLDLIAEAIDRRKSPGLQVLAVDDDADNLAAIKAILEHDDIRVSTLDSPLNFWRRLEEVQPDVILLDIAMPQVSGFDICRTVRSDSRWSSTPILFLSGRSDPDTITAAFEAGADDFISKPFERQELVARIRARAQRVQGLRRTASLDPLTGAVNRRAATELAEILIRQAIRNGGPLSVAITDIDKFKGINDTYGHAAGDRVLARLGGSLRAAFRADDVIARWGGDEFVVVTVGLDPVLVRKRIESAVDAVNVQAADSEQDDEPNISCSTGISAYPEGGDSLTTLIASADKRLYEVKSGRSRS